jgi:hypothetical protein
LSDFSIVDLFLDGLTGGWGMRILISVLALAAGLIAPAAAQITASTVQAIVLTPLSIAFGDIGAQLRLFGAGIRAMDSQRITADKRVALAAELDNLIPSIDRLTAGKGQFYLLLSQEQQAAHLRGSAPLTGELTAARQRSWMNVSAAARLLGSDLRVVNDQLSRSPTLRSELPTDTANSLSQVLKGKGALDSAIAKMQNGPENPSQDEAVLARLAEDYLNLRGELYRVADALRAFRRTLADAH